MFRMITRRLRTRTQLERSRSGSYNDDRRVLSAAPSVTLLEKHIAEVGTMNLGVTHGAGLIFRGLIVYRTDRAAGRQRGRESVAPQTEHVHRHHIQQSRISRAVRRVATGTAFGFHGHVFVDEGALFIGVAFVANEIAARQAPNLPHDSCSMRIVAVAASHQALVNAVMIRLGKIRLGRDMASIAQLRLLLDEKELFFLGVMGRVAVETSDIVTGVGGLGEMRLFVSFAVAT